VPNQKFAIIFYQLKQKTNKQETWKMTESLDALMILFLIFAGFLAAFVDASVGGGGLISVPALMFTGLPLPAVVGTNKLSACLSLTTSTSSYLKSGKVHRRLVFSLFPLSMLGSVLGAWVIRHASAEWLKPFVVVMLLAVVVLTLGKKNWGTVTAYRGLRLRSALGIGAAAFVIGFYDGFLGVGTGVFLTFCFALMGFDFVVSAGNARVLNLASNLGSLVTFFIFDLVHVVYGLCMGLAMIIGAYAGSRTTISRGTGYVKLLLVSVSLLFIGRQIWEWMQEVPHVISTN
jgi:uncharacterized membrane protein YfcA